MSALGMRTSNPALSDAVFRRARQESDTASVMTLQGTVVKTLILVAILLVAAAILWSQTLTLADQRVQVVNPTLVVGAMIVGFVLGFVISLITIFVPRTAPITAPLYAACEGLALGGISAFFEMRYPGIALEAMALTVGLLVILLVLYGTGMVKVTAGFRAGVIAATMAIALVYLGSMILSLFGVRNPFVYGSGWLGIGFSLFVVVIASMNLVLDFDMVRRNVDARAPKFMEWYCGFGLLVTLVWLYLELLRLLAKLRSR